MYISRCFLIKNIQFNKIINYQSNMSRRLCYSHRYQTDLLPLCVIRRRVLRDINGFYKNFHFHKMPTRKFYISENIHNRNKFKYLYFSTKSDNDDNQNNNNVIDLVDVESLADDGGGEEMSTSEDNEALEYISLKDLLYTKGRYSDAEMDKLNETETYEDILNVINKDIHLFYHQHLVQAILLLWQNYKLKLQNLHSQSKLSDNEIQKQYFELTQKLNKSEEFALLLDKLKVLSSKMTADELSCCFMYLTKLQVKIQHPTMTQIIIDYMKFLKNAEDTSITSLSRITVTMSNNKKEMYPLIIAADILPKVIKHLENCIDSDHLKLITICLINLRQIISKDMLEMYRNKVSKLIDENQIILDKRCTLKMIMFLNFPHWSNQNATLIRKLMLILKDKIPTFQAKELEIVFQTFQNHLEPAELLNAIIEKSENLLARKPSAELLVCSVLYALPEKRLAMTNIAKQIINSDGPLHMSTLIALFKVLRILKISNMKICHLYWTKLLNEINNNKNQQEDYNLIRNCHRYMYFNNNLGGTYRHIEFERKIVKFVLNDIKTGLSAVIPSKFAKLIAFVIAYGHIGDNNVMLPIEMLDKMEQCYKQFTILDCLMLSRGLQIAMELRYKKYVPNGVEDQYNRIESLLNWCTREHLNLPDLTLTNLNNIVRSYISRNSSRKSQLFYKIIQKYDSIDGELSSRLIRDITNNLNYANCLLPNMCDKMLKYMFKNRNYIIGDTVEKILYCCYNLGYVPETDNYYKSAVDIIHRDFNYMNGVSIIQACLALTYYRAIPNTLINRVFCIDFIKRLEDEISMCYSKTTYPQLVLNQVMQLNRAVCLDYPEVGIPWFQQNYVEAQMSRNPFSQNNFHKSIKDGLLLLLPDEKHMKINHITPYGYRIDFVLNCDKNRNFIIPPENEKLQENFTKIAIVLLKFDAFSQNINFNLRGHIQLKQRHLEMLGYKVIQISINDWNSRYLKPTETKINYLKKLLQII